MDSSPIALLVDFDVDAIGDGWTELTDAGRTVAAGHERNRWVLGDLASRVTTVYGKDSLGKYVAELGDKIHYKAMTDYRTVSRFYPKEVRELHPHLSWSHYREAKRLKDFESAMDALQSSADKLWTVTDLKDAVDVALQVVRSKPIKFTARVVMVGKKTVLLAVSNTTAFVEGQVYKFSATVDKGDE